MGLLMHDLLAAVLGPKHCGWCNEQPTTWWENLTDQNELGNSPILWKRSVVKIQNWFGDHIPLWRLGNRRHNRRHIPYDDPRKIKERWVASKQLGDVVCDCRGLHLKIAEFRSAEDVVLEDDSVCSLYHCCSEPDDSPEPECHHGISLDHYWER